MYQKQEQEQEANKRESCLFFPRAKTTTLEAHEVVLNEDSKATSTNNKEDHPNDALQEHDDILSTLQCRMPSSTTPWMMQRVKWMKGQNEEMEKNDMVGPYRGFIHSDSATENDVALFSMGITCQTTGLTKVMNRFYNKKSGMLELVDFCCSGKTSSIPNE